MANKSKINPGMPEEDEEEYVVIKKTTLLIALLPIVFLLGGVIGMVAGIYIGGGSLNLSRRGASAAEAPSAPSGGAAQQPTDLPAPIDVSVDDDPSLGPENAPVTIVAFSDFQCPYCGRFALDTFDQLMAEYDGQIRFVFRDFPLTQMHPDSLGAHIAAECANEQGKFWEMHDLIFANQTALDTETLQGYAEQLNLDMTAFNSCLEDPAMEDEVMADVTDGGSYGVVGTPYFFVNGILIRGAQPLSAFESLINQELAGN